MHESLFVPAGNKAFLAQLWSSPPRCIVFDAFKRTFPLNAAVLIGELCSLPFFESVTWGSLLDQEPPFVPSPDNDTDTGYFDARNQMQHLQLSSFGS
ncbi:hypothetical protein HPB49_004550 [Dermacentor silvarum]|uniref:Uncharacterized protein n=1 Tax=Dermacentor silvarum TaxID=543639 RepID=A0ACB8DB88_DERSI|nr:hypothetical protein HPB49_004550 [Dermacentor silvarum]